MVHLAKLLHIVGERENWAKRLADLTPGMSGADIANVVNEGALIAARTSKEAVELSDCEAAIESVIGGLEKKSRVLSHKEKKIVAYHEAGHAIAGWFLQHADPLLKVSIIPRGSAALGYAQLQSSDKFLINREQFLDRICTTLGGRAAEHLIFGEITTGASDDLEKVTKWAYSQISYYGMDDSIGNLSYPMPDQNEVERPYSQHTSRLIDLQVRSFVNDAYQRTLNLLTEHRSHLEQVAQRLLQKEVINADDMAEIVGQRPWANEFSDPLPSSS